MNTFPSEATAELNAYYGNPDSNSDGAADPLWEAANIVNLVPPYKMVLAWDTSRSVSRIRCHRKVSDSLTIILHNIASHYGTQSEIEAARLHLFGGAYMFRLMRGSPRLSVHSWGAAIDLDPAYNQFGRRYDESLGMMPHVVADIFAEQGWTWGGHWPKADAMHFQAARV
jgi:hypothetical protein